MGERERAFLAALQLADSALPIGRFAHSLGLEALLQANPDAGEGEIIELVGSVIREGVGPLDGVAVADAHAARRLDSLIGLDLHLSARKLMPPARQASTSCGAQLAAIAPLLTSGEPAIAFSAAVRDRKTNGNLAVMEGALAHAMGLRRDEAVLLSLRGTAAQLLSAALRLARMSARGAQAALRGLEPVLLASASEALSLSAEDMRSTAPELDVHSLLHMRADVRLFVT